MQSHSGFVIIDEFIELLGITYIELRKTKEPLINIDRMFIANGGRLEKIICILLCLCFCYILLNIFVESHSFVQVNGLKIIEVNIIENLCKLGFLITIEYCKCFLLRNEHLTEESKLMLLSTFWRLNCCLRVCNPFCS